MRGTIPAPRRFWVVVISSSSPPADTARSLCKPPNLRRGDRAGPGPHFPSGSYWGIQVRLAGMFVSYWPTSRKRFEVYITAHMPPSETHAETLLAFGKV